MASNTYVVKDSKGNIIRTSTFGAGIGNAQLQERASTVKSNISSTTLSPQQVVAQTNINVKDLQATDLKAQLDKAASQKASFESKLKAINDNKSLNIFQKEEAKRELIGASSGYGTYNLIKYHQQNQAFARQQQQIRDIENNRNLNTIQREEAKRQLIGITSGIPSQQGLFRNQNNNKSINDIAPYKQVFGNKSTSNKMFPAEINPNIKPKYAGNQISYSYDTKNNTFIGGGSGNINFGALDPRRLVTMGLIAGKTFGDIVSVGGFKNDPTAAKQFTNTIITTGTTLITQPISKTLIDTGISFAEDPLGFIVTAYELELLGTGVYRLGIGKYRVDTAIKNIPIPKFKLFSEDVVQITKDKITKLKKDGITLRDRTIKGDELRLLQAQLKVYTELKYKTTPLADLTPKIQTKIKQLKQATSKTEKVGLIKSIVKLTQQYHVAKVVVLNYLAKSKDLITYKKELLKAQKLTGKELKKVQSKFNTFEKPKTSIVKSGTRSIINLSKKDIKDIKKQKIPTKIDKLLTFIKKNYIVTKSQAKKIAYILTKNNYTLITKITKQKSMLEIGFKKLDNIKFKENFKGLSNDILIKRLENARLVSGEAFSKLKKSIEKETGLKVKVFEKATQNKVFDLKKNKIVNEVKTTIKLLGKKEFKAKEPKTKSQSINIKEPVRLKNLKQAQQVSKLQNLVLEIDGKVIERIEPPKRNLLTSKKGQVRFQGNVVKQVKGFFNKAKSKVKNIKNDIQRIKTENKGKIQKIKSVKETKKSKNVSNRTAQNNFDRNKQAIKGFLSRLKSKSKTISKTEIKLISNKIDEKIDTLNKINNKLVTRPQIVNTTARVIKTTNNQIKTINKDIISLKTEIRALIEYLSKLKQARILTTATTNSLKSDLASLIDSLNLQKKASDLAKAFLIQQLRKNGLTNNQLKIPIDKQKYVFKQQVKNKQDIKDLQVLKDKLIFKFEKGKLNITLPKPNETKFRNRIYINTPILPPYIPITDVPKPPVKPKIDTPDEPTDTPKIFIVLNRNGKKSKYLRAYDILYRSKGKVKRLKLHLPLNKALKKGIYLIDNTTSRSFELRVVGLTRESDISKPSLKKFSIKKGKKALLLVEKSKYSIDTHGEKSGLSIGKLLKSKKKVKKLTKKKKIIKKSSKKRIIKKSSKKIKKVMKKTIKRYKKSPKKSYKRAKSSKVKKSMSIKKKKR